MLHGVFKEHQVHNRIHFIVSIQGLHQSLVEELPGGDGQVSEVPDATSKVAVD